MEATGNELAVSSIFLRHISLAFDNQQLFDDLCLEFTAGQCTCILGASGCGKSTLFKMIAGSFSLPYRGEVGGSYADKSAVKGPLNRLCALMGQDDLLLPWFNALDNVLLGARLRGEINDTVRSNALDLLAKMGLLDSCSLLPASLSGGMRQRVALARTLMESRPIMLMDEPFSALDALTRQKMQNLAAEFTHNRTVLLVTHDPMEALRLGHTILVLGGSPSRLVHRFDPGGALPRDVSDPVVQKLYPRLLSLLLEEVQ